MRKNDLKLRKYALYRKCDEMNNKFLNTKNSVQKTGLNMYR